MKRILSALFAVFAVLVLALAACNPGLPQPDAGDGIPHGISVAGALGAYLSPDGATASVRGVVSATAGTLGIITATGVPETAEFVDDVGDTVVVTISKAVALTDRYILITYSYAEGGATATLDLETGALAEVSVIPDDWARIAALGTIAFYTSGGTVYSTDLTSGAALVLSTGATTWSQSISAPPAETGTSAWTASATRIFAGSDGSAYAFCTLSSEHHMAMAFKSDGTPVDFGDNYEGYLFSISMPDHSLAAVTWAAVQPSAGNVVLIKGDDLWDNDPLAVGGAEITGSVLQVFEVVMDAELPGVFDLPIYPSAAAVFPDVGVRTTFVSAGLWGIWTNGASTFVLTEDPVTLTHYDTAAVPRETAEHSYEITSWIFSGGELYAGPSQGDASVDLVDLDVPVATAQLASDVVTWSVVSGVLFWNYGVATWQAAIDTEAGTIATPAVFDGPVPTPITQ